MSAEDGLAEFEIFGTVGFGEGCGKLTFAGGSVLEYTGDAFVNAANEGCVGGFGIDEMVNRSGGDELKAARKALGGCDTGNAKVTASFAHERTKFIIHAVGPVYRVNPLKQGFGEHDERAAPYMKSLDPLLVSAYRMSLARAREVGARSVGFCLLSAGVFRGARALEDIVHIGARSLLHILRHHEYANFDEVALIAYSPEERDVLKRVAIDLASEVSVGGDGGDHPVVKELLV